MSIVILVLAKGLMAKLDQRVALERQPQERRTRRVGWSMGMTGFVPAIMAERVCAAIMPSSRLGWLMVVRGIGEWLAQQMPS